MKHTERVERIRTILIRMVLCLLLTFSGSMALAQAPDDGHQHGASSAPEAGEVPSPPEQRYAYGVVVEVSEKEAQPDSGFFHPVHHEERMQEVKVRVLTGERKDQILTSQNVLGENPAYNIPVSPGSRVLLNMEKNPDGEWEVYIANRDRTPALWILTALVAIGILTIGGKTVTKHVLLASGLLLAVYWVLFPTILMGRYATLAALGLCFGYTVLGTLIYKNPSELKGQPSPPLKTHLVIVGGSMGGLLMMVLLLWLMGIITPLGGFSEEALAALWYDYPDMDFWTLYLAGSLIGYQGFMFYLVWMLAQQRRDGRSGEGQHLTFRERFRVMMVRGRRLLAPMISSLSLLFMGLHLPLLLQVRSVPAYQFINLESTASLIVMGLSGILALILTVPLTAWLVATSESRSAG